MLMSACEHIHIVQIPPLGFKYFWFRLTKPTYPTLAFTLNVDAKEDDAVIYSFFFFFFLQTKELNWQQVFFHHITLCPLPVLGHWFNLTWLRKETVVRQASLMAEGRSQRTVILAVTHTCPTCLSIPNNKGNLIWWWECSLCAGNKLRSSLWNRVSRLTERKFLKCEVCWLQIQLFKNVPSPRRVLTGELQSLNVVVCCCLLQQKKTDNNKEVHKLS